MRHPYWILERHSFGEDGLSGTIHIIQLPEESAGGSYRQIGILESFVTRVLERWYNFWRIKPTHKSQCKYTRYRPDEEEIRDIQRKNMVERYNQEFADKLFPQYEKVEHADAYAFFKHIGYDYKNKKVSNTDKFIFIEKKENK